MPHCSPLVQLRGTAMPVLTVMTVGSKELMGRVPKVAREVGHAVPARSQSSMVLANHPTSMHPVPSKIQREKIGSGQWHAQHCQLLWGERTNTKTLSRQAFLSSIHHIVLQHHIPPQPHFHHGRQPLGGFKPLAGLLTRTGHGPMNHDVRPQLLRSLPCEPSHRPLPLHRSAAFVDGIATDLETPNG